MSGIAVNGRAQPIGLPAVFAVGCALSALVWLVGCGSADRTVVVGSVTYEGEPVENGFIRFFPIEGTAGPMWGAQIIDGRFRADGKGGVPVGTHRVEIEAFRAVPRPPPGPDLFEDFGGQGPAMAEVQYIPPRYNARSELKLVVASQRGNLEVAYELEE